MKNFPLFSTALIWICCSNASGRAAAFTPTDAGLPGLANSSVAWGDLNNNGRLDLVLTGTDGDFNRVAQVWQNLGGHQFINRTAAFPGLPPVSSGSVVWGDYDNDGHWDFLLTGFAGLDAGGLPIRIAHVWRNLGDGNFVRANAGLPGTVNDAAAWGDFDNDGDLDLLLTGFSNAGARADIWRNDGAAGFVNSNAGLPGVFNSSVALGDFDQDGHLDILLAGTTNGFISGALTQMWRNSGGGVFTKLNAGLPGVSQAAVAWGDFDNDGWLDLLVTGFASTGPVAQIWRNLGGGHFALTDSGLPGVSQGSVATGDFDNDGHLDVLLSGVTADGTLICEVWRNLGDGTFSNLAAGLPGVRAGAVAWADFDNDGRLDILMTGFDAGNNVIGRLYRNDTAPGNRPVPRLFATAVRGNGDFEFSFRGRSGLPYLIWTSTNVLEWTVLGAPREVSPQLFRFRDGQAGAHAVRFYHTSSP
jgi:hypothetical protein